MAKRLDALKSENWAEYAKYLQESQTKFIALMERNQHILLEHLELTLEEWAEAFKIAMADPSAKAEMEKEEYLSKLDVDKRNMTESK